MATNTTSYTGESGVVKFSDTASSVAAVASVRNFTIDQETDAIESTVMGAGNRSYLPGLRQFSGTMDVFFRDDTSGGAGQEALFNAAKSTQSTSTAIELYPSGETTGIKLSGNVIITGHSITSNFDGMVEASITFQGDGALTRTNI
jgi:predicted secreted protein